MVEKQAVKLCRVYGIKNCDSMKKAFAWLDSHDFAYEFVDYKKAGVAAERLPEWSRRVGWKRLLNTRGLMWKRLSIEQRAGGIGAAGLDEAQALALMAEYPSLIKRPVAEYADNLLVGFDPECYLAEFVAGSTP